LGRLAKLSQLVNDGITLDRLADFVPNDTLWLEEVNLRICDQRAVLLASNVRSDI
jgi:hypothetical protein